MSRPLKALGLMFLTIWLSATLVFFALSLLPSKAIEAQLSESGASAAIIAERRAKLGLADPLLTRYARFMSGLVRGDLGNSLLDGLPVHDLIFQRFAHTAALALIAVFVAVLLGLGLGVAGALHIGWGISTTARTATSLALSTPIYWTGSLALVIFLFAFDGANLPQNGVFFTFWLLPVLVLGFHTSGAVARVIQINVQITLQSDYVRFARAKGLRERTVLWKHVLPPSLLPAISVIALQTGFLLGGTVFTETIFLRPGIGQLLIDRTIRQDYPVVQGIVILSAVIYVLVNQIADVVTRILDPRISR